MTHRNQILPCLLLALAASGAVQAQCPAGEASYEQGRQIRAHYQGVCPQPCLEQRRYFYQQAVAACPEEARYHNDLADAHEKLGQYELAIAHYSRAIELDPHLAIPYFGLADVHFLRQDYRQAIAAYQQGLALAPEDKLARRFLLEAQARLRGEDDAGIASFGAVMSAAPPETRLALHIHFETDRHDLTATARGELDRLARQMGPILAQQPGTRFLIEGHTDVRGSEQHNLDLSIHRARTVAETLASAHAIPADALALQGFGESRPLRMVAETADDGAHAINRRVEIVRLNQPELAALLENRWAEPLEGASQPQLAAFEVSVGVLYQDIGGQSHPSYAPHDPLPRLRPGQGYRLYFRPAQPSHVYVFQLTGDAVTPLWPRDASAEVLANAAHWLPKEHTGDWLEPPAEPDQSATLYTGGQPPAPCRHRGPPAPGEPGGRRRCAALGPADRAVSTLADDGGEKGPRGAQPSGACPSGGSRASPGDALGPGGDGFRVAVADAVGQSEEREEAMMKKTLGRLRWMLALVLVAVVGATWGAGMAELYEKGMERYARSDFQGALTYWKSGLELAREQDNRRIESVFLTNLSVVYRNLGQYPKALEHLRQALAIDREIGDRKGEGHDLTNLGVVYWSLGQYPKALEHYRQALAIFAQLDVPGKRNAEANIGDVHLERGQYSEALEIFQRLNAPVRLGRYYLKTQDYAQARQWFAKSLQKAEASQVAEFLLADHIGLGLAAEGLKDLEQARQHYRKAVDLIEAQREELTPAQRRHFFQAKVQGFARLSPYEGLARIAARLGQAGEALHWSEHTKARVLLEDLARKGPDNPIGLPPELAAQEAELNRELAVVHKQIQIAREQDNRAFLQEREARLAQLKSERQAFLTRLRRSHPEYAAIQYPAPIGLADLKLAPHEVLIQYEVTDRTTLAWLIKGGKVRLDFGHFGSFPGS